MAFRGLYHFASQLFNYFLEQVQLETTAHNYIRIYIFFIYWYLLK